MDLLLLNSTITSLKFAGDLAKGFLELKNTNDISGMVYNLQSAILAAQSSAMEANAAQFSMVEEIRALKAEIASIKAWDAEKVRYKLTTKWPGSIVYALKESMSQGEPPHWICTKCYEDGRKSILNPKEDPAGYVGYGCPICKSFVPSPWRNATAAEYAPD